MLDHVHSEATAYDVASIRRDFPALALKPYGKPLVFLDNAASAQKPRVVLDRMTTAYETEYANVHRGLHYLANAATEAFEMARETVRAFLNAESADEIVFTRSATEAINLVAASFGLAHIEAGDEIVLSIMEHHSNIVPWHFLRERKGAVLKWVGVDEEGNLSLDEFERALSPRTKIVAITHMSNVLGTITPIRDIIQIAHARGIPVLVDGSQGAVHLDPDVRALDADFYVFTGHKVYGPTGIGVLYGKKELLAGLPPFNGGGEMIDMVTTDTVTYNAPPHRFEAGTPPIVEAIGLGAALDYMRGIGRDRIRAHEADLTRYAHERLGRINSLRIYGTARDKGAIVSFSMQNAHPHDIATVIDQRGVAVRAGTHCTMPLMQRFGVTATCRASFGLYNTREEVDALADALLKAEAPVLVNESPMSDAAPSEVQPNQPEIEPGSAIAPAELDTITEGLVAALKTVYDPEIPVDIYELGLIYKIEIDDSKFVAIDMTLTAPACPVAGEMPGWVETACAAVPGVAGAKVNMVFDPPWDQSRMSDEARVALDMW